jgi:glycosyltransferase involved in cell wall biosynthesis
MASRCVAVMPHFSGLEQLFIPGQELVSFSTLRELSQKLSDLKQDGQRYETMLGCAYTKLLEEFSWERRWRQIEAVIYQHQQQKSPRTKQYSDKIKSGTRNSFDGG